MSSTTIYTNPYIETSRNYSAKDSQRGVGLIGGISILFLVILLIIIIFVTTVIRNFSRQVDENLPSIVSIANQVDDALQTIQVLGPQLSDILRDYIDGICLPRQDLCPSSAELFNPDVNLNQCPVLCKTILSSKEVCETPSLENNTFCKNIIDPLF